MEVRIMYLNLILVFSIFSVHAWTGHFKTKEPCEITVEHSHQPILLNSRNEFLYPDKGKVVTINQNQQILVGCPGTKLPTGSIFENAVCVSNTIFVMNGKKVDLNSTLCDAQVKGIARYTNKTCETSGKEIEIGFQLPNTFLRLIQICFDDANYTSLYSHFNLTRYPGADHEITDSPNFHQDNFYNIQSVNNLYKRTNQRATINNLLGLPVNDTTYIQDDAYFYLARGHLTAKCDFVYGFQMDLTFHYVNAAPQWQAFNGRNWESVEDNVRKLATARSLDLSIYTGTFGVSTLPDTNGTETLLYLYVNGAQKEIPVPKLYWKVVLNPITTEAVAIVGVNNPYDQDVSSYFICENVLSKLSWLKLKHNEPSKGYIYACGVEDFRRTVRQLPKFSVSGLLI